MFTTALNDLMASVFFTVSSITRFILKARTGSRAPACVLRAAAAALRIRPSLVPPPVTRSGTERSLCSRSPRTLLSLVWISQPSPTLFFFFFFLAPARLLLLFFWDYIFFWWFFNSNSMHRKWVNCTRNMVSFVFISLREITAPLLLLLLLLRYFRVTLFIVFWLSFPFSLSSRNL